MSPRIAEADELSEDELLELDAIDAAANTGTAVFRPPLDTINPVYIPHLDNMARTQIFYGGSGSGKSRFKAQQAVSDVLQGNGRNWLVCRKIGKDNRGSTFVEINNVIDAWGVNGRFAINKTDLTITCDNGYQILFKGLDDLEKLKSITVRKGAVTDIWVEEATQIERDDLKQLYKRQRGGREDVPKRVHLTFNPILQIHWIYIDFFASWADDQTEYNDGRLSILKTWYIHNRFLTADDVYDLEHETDKYYRDVYTLGNWGVLGNVIFTNWEMRDLSDMEAQFTNRRNGLDFGFSSDPAAVVKSHYDRKRQTIYIYGELYETGLTNDVLAKETLDLIGNDAVRCDSAEPKSIKELRMHGVDAHPADKGRDSVLHGVQWLQQQTIIIDKRCINTKNEFLQYKWKEDKNGNAMRQPIDYNDHIIAALRYAYERDMVVIKPRRVPSVSMAHAGIG